MTAEEAGQMEPAQKEPEEEEAAVEEEGSMGSIPDLTVLKGDKAESRQFLLAPSGATASEML